MSKNALQNSQSFVDRFNNLSLVKKLTAGFSVSVSLICIVVATNYVFAQRVARIEQHMTQVLIPAIEAEINLKNTVNESVSHLQAYLLLGNANLKKKRAQAWHKIDETVSELEASVNDLDASVKSTLTEIKGPLDQLRRSQQRAELENSRGNTDVAKRILSKELDSALENTFVIVEKLSKQLHHLIEKDEAALSFSRILMEAISFILALLAIVVSIVVARFITAQLVQSIEKVEQSVDDMVNGEFRHKINASSTDEMGRLLLKLDDMRFNLKSIIEDDVKSMIDNASMGNLSERIDTQNKSGAYRDLCEGINELLSINSKIIDETVTVFSDLSNGNLTTAIKSEYEGDFALIKQDANFTIEKLRQIIQVDVQSVLDTAEKGDFSKRIPLEGKEGFFLSLSEKINSFIDKNQFIIEDISRVFNSMSNGNLNSTITNHYQGEFSVLKENTNAVVSQIKMIIEQEVQSVVDAALKGDLDKKIQEENKKGFFKDLSTSINQLTEISKEIVKDASHVVGAIANGDLTQVITTDYHGSFAELKNNVNSTVDRLKTVVTDIHEAAALVNSGSSEIAIGVNDLSERTEQQAASLEETAASMEQMTTSVQQSASNAKEASDMTAQAEQCAVSGGIAVDSAVEAMKGINESSTKIANIIGVIDEIAFQTNLLALNAAVEAARAGEQGRGFAVVAGEVRTLAQRSASAAKEIKDLISDSVSRVENGSKLVSDSGDTLKEIIDSVKQVSTAITHLSSAGEQQYTGIQQVNSAVLNMDQMTQQNAALVEESSAACQGMSDQAQKLTELVSFFNTGTENTHFIKKTEPKPSAENRIDTPKTKLKVASDTVAAVKTETKAIEKTAATKVEAKTETKVDAKTKENTVKAKTSTVEKPDTKLLRPNIEAVDSDFDMDGDWEEF